MAAGRHLIRSYADDLKLFGGKARKLGLLVLAAVYVLVPLTVFKDNDQWMTTLTLAGVTAVGAIGLNLLTGYTGQVSLGSAAFVGLGAFTAGYLGRAVDLGGKGQPLVVYLAVALVLGGVVGFFVGLPALRLRGNYLAVVTLGFIFIALYVWQNWDTVTGGNAGSAMPVKMEVALGPTSFDFNSVNFRGEVLSRNHGLFYLVWAIVAIVALLVKNIVRTRPGRALQAVRDRDVAAEVVGVSLFRYKVGAFVISSGILALAGALYGLWIQNLAPSEQSLGLALSISYLAIIIVGGVATIYGPIVGALLVGSLPSLIDLYADKLPFVAGSPTESGITADNLEAGLYAVLIIVFLVLEPAGLAGIWRRVQAYFRTWPFAR